MPDEIVQRGGLTLLRCAVQGSVLSADDDALDLIGQALAHDTDLVVIPVARLDERFFTLSTGIAGGILQKFVNYRLRLAIVGDISRQVDASSALRDFVHESNRGNHVWFVAEDAELDTRLDRIRPRGSGA